QRRSARERGHEARGRSALPTRARAVLAALRRRCARVGDCDRVAGARARSPRRSRLKIAILAPTDFSIYARGIAAFVHDEPGLELVLVAVRRIAGLERLRSELRRDGVRLLRKFWRKALLGSDDGASRIASVIEARGVPATGLRELCARHGV